MTFVRTAFLASRSPDLVTRRPWTVV